MKLIDGMYYRASYMSGVWMIYKHNNNKLYSHFFFDGIEVGNYFVIDHENPITPIPKDDVC
jgi:hypothetical protein